MSKLYVQYGCGLSAPEQWLNFDISPTLRLQKIPVVGSITQKITKVSFPKNVKYGDIIKGLPVENNSCDGLFCSHTLEHMTLEDFRKALKNSYKLLKQGGIFRCIVPDLELAAREYISKIDAGDKRASIQFMKDTLLGIESRPKGFKKAISSVFGYSHHLWMWDKQSLAAELEDAGFINVRFCHYSDSKDEMFLQAENKYRFINAVAIECCK